MRKKVQSTKCRVQSKNKDGVSADAPFLIPGMSKGKGKHRVNITIIIKISGGGGHPIEDGCVKFQVVGGGGRAL
ncbi:MAG: hypothetical protein ABI690_03940 [Chloroflexota bacterium]